MNVLRMPAEPRGFAIRRQIWLLAALGIVALVSLEVLDWIGSGDAARISGHLAVVALASAAILFFCWRLELGIMRPLARMEEAVGRWSAGDFDFRAPIGGAGEMRLLGERLNHMAGELDRMCREQSTIADALRASEVRLQMALESGAVSIWDTDVRTGLCWLSEGWAALLGAPPGPSCVPMDQLIALFHPDDIEEVLSAARDVMKGLQSFYVREHRVRDVSGGWRWILSRGRVTARDERGRAIRMSGTNVDITDLKLAEQALRAAEERRQQELVAAKAALEERVAARTRELVDANRELEALAYTVSHDLRAPLRFMGGCCRLVEDALREGAPERATELLRGLDDAAERMLRLVEGLLEFSRLGRQPIERGVVDLRVVVDEVLRDLALAPGRWEVSIGALPAVSADPVLARQVFANLLSNAAKYAATRERPRIEVGCERSGGETVVYVRDNGVGFSMRYADKLFEAFQRLHPSSQFPGVGVGLAIVRRIVERHGGRVWAESKVGEGATFRFTLGDAAA